MKTLDQHEFEQQNVFGLGAANDAYARYFTGQSYLWPTSPSSRAAGTTGTSTTLRPAADSCSSAPPARAGIRRRAGRRRA